jgi:formate hydrogenlyase subunit 3/multisubunit Na+/H+ antiporter MnhD subunit
MKLKGIFKTEKLAGLIFIISAFSLTGIPIFAGFRSKLFIFEAISKHNLLILIPLVLVIVLEFSYFFRAIQSMIFSDTEDVLTKSDKKGVNPLFLYVSLLFALALIVFGFFPEGVVKISNEAAKQLSDPSLYVKAVLGGM